MNRLIANRGLLQIFFALMLVIIVMFVSNFIVYRKSISGIYEKVTQNNRLVVKNMIQSFDSAFASVNNLIFTIHGLPYDGVISPFDGHIDMARVYSMRDSIASLSSSLDFVEEVVVYYDDADLAITTKGTTDLGLLFGGTYRHDVYTADYWRAYAKSKHSATVFPAASFGVSTDAYTHAGKSLMIATDGNKVRLSDKNVLVLINVDKLMNHVARQAVLPGASLIVLDQNRNVVLSTEKNLDLMNVLNDVIIGNAREASVTSRNFEYNIYHSDYNGFIYVDKVPYRFKNIDSVSDASRMIMISAIACACVLAALLSIYLYKPVKDILRLLGGGAVKGNDFRKIQSGIVKVQSENESLRKQMDYADAQLRRSVFLQTLDALSQSPEHELQMQRYYRHFFQERHFILAGLYLKPAGTAESGSTLPPEELTERIRSGLSRHGLRLTELFHVEGLAFLVLIAANRPQERKPALEAIRRFAAQFQKERGDAYSVLACVSKAYESKVANCQTAYRELAAGMRYRHVNESDAGAVVDPETIRYEASVHLPLEKVEKLSNCLLFGRTNEALRIADEILEENASRRVHHHQLVFVAKSLFYQMTRHCDSLADGGEDRYRLETEFFGRTEQACGFREIREALADTVRYLAEHRKNDRQNKLNPAFIAQYLELHYMENLYLDHMAEILDTSPKYFSNYFKKTFGINYVEYLNKVKLAHAKEYLKNTDMSIAEIGEKTGYMNSSTFTTTFKKYCGLSPSEYRKRGGGELPGA